MDQAELNKAIKQNYLNPSVTGHLTNTLDSTCNRSIQVTSSKKSRISKKDMVMRKNMCYSSLDEGGMTR